MTWWPATERMGPAARTAGPLLLRVQPAEAFYLLTNPGEAMGVSMTLRHFHRTACTIGLLTAFVCPVRLAAQQHTRSSDRFPRYTVQDLGTLGGPYNFSYNLNDAGVVSGGSATA